MQKWRTEKVSIRSRGLKIQAEPMDRGQRAGQIDLRGYAKQITSEMN
jgi:hypothetical protein